MSVSRSPSMRLQPKLPTRRPPGSEASAPGQTGALQAEDRRTRWESVCFWGGKEGPGAQSSERTLSYEISRTTGEICRKRATLPLVLAARPFSIA